MYSTTRTRTRQHEGSTSPPVTRRGRWSWMPPSVTALREVASGHDDLEHDALLALASADDLESAMEAVVESVLGESAVERVEWWAAGDGGDLELAAAAGRRIGTSRSVPIGSAGTFVLHGGDDAELD